MLRVHPPPACPVAKPKSFADVPGMPFDECPFIDGKVAHRPQRVVCLLFPHVFDDPFLHPFRQMRIRQGQGVNDLPRLPLHEVRLHLAVHASHRRQVPGVQNLLDLPGQPGFHAVRFRRDVANPAHFPDVSIRVHVLSVGGGSQRRTCHPDERSHCAHYSTSFPAPS